MKQQEFDQIASQLNSFSAKQRHSLLEWLHCPEKIPDIVEHLEQNLHRFDPYTAVRFEDEGTMDGIC